MAHFIKIPKDLSEIKEKFLFGLTKRQVICFAIGLAMGIPTFFLTRSALGLEGGVMMLGVAAAPAIICGIYVKNGVPFEKQMRFLYEFLRRPKKRYYRTANIYRCIANQMEYARLQRLLEQTKTGGGKADGTVQKGKAKSKPKSK